MSFIPKPQEIYKHFKGNLYQITAVAEHTETGELLVIYQALYGEFKTYARPLSMFTERLDREKYPDAVQEFRFELQGPEAARQKAESEPAPARSWQSSKPESRQETGQQPARTEPQETQFAQQPATQPAQASPRTAPEEPTAEELNLDPLVLEFLDADGYGQRLNILAGLHHRITDDMITTMAIACDVEINDGDVEERYEALKNCLMMLERYECNRLR